MKKLNLRTKFHRQYLEIPVDFIDEYMPQAPEGALKVYLYLLRCSLDDSILLSLSDMADLFDVTQKAVLRSLMYWEDCGLLALEYAGDELSDITLYPFSGESVPAADSAADNTEKAPEAAAPARSSVPSSSTPANIHELPQKTAPETNPALLSDLSGDDNFSDLLDLAQHYLKKPANSTMRDTLGYCYLLFERSTTSAPLRKTGSRKGSPIFRPSKPQERSARRMSPLSRKLSASATVLSERQSWNTSKSGAGISTFRSSKKPAPAR